MIKMEDGSQWYVDMEAGECGAEGKEAIVHSIFVDNLPETMGTKGLYTIFSNYGVVVDVFIPTKRRKLT
ncbi:hypothetical protein ACSBR1_031770 [Camellia fascicularis]